MLGDAKIMAFAGTLNADRARAFYRDTLGLKLVEENHFALVFDCNGTMLRLQNVHELQPAKHTTLGWEVPDIRSAVKQAAAAGVSFSRFPGMPQDEDGIWTSPFGAHVAWFQDPDGNTLSLTQFIPR